jgi:hypothetical protein
MWWSGRKPGHLERKVCEERARERIKKNNKFNGMRNFICLRKREEKTDNTKREKKEKKLRRKHLGEVPRRENVCW